MDANEHILTGKFNREIVRTGFDLGKFTHICWGAHQPYTHINESKPINGGYKSPEIEVLNVCMLPFLDSPGDHCTFITNISTRLLLGEFWYKVCRPISCCLIMSQQGSADEYNRIVHKQFNQHCILECLDAVDKMTRYCGFPHQTFMCHDHQALQANDRDKDSCREEVPKDFATRQQLPPNSPNVVRQNTCLSPTDPIEGGKSQKHWQCNPLCHTDQHTDPRQIVHGGAKKWSKILPNLKSRAPKAS